MRSITASGCGLFVLPQYTDFSTNATPDSCNLAHFPISKGSISGIKTA